MGDPSSAHSFQALTCLKLESLLGIVLELTDEGFDAVGAADVGERDLDGVAAGGGELDGADAQESEEAALPDVDGTDVADAHLVGVLAEEAGDDLAPGLSDEVVGAGAVEAGEGEEEAGERDAAEREPAAAGPEIVSAQTGG